MKNNLNLIIVCLILILFCKSMHANEISKLEIAYEQLQLNPNNRIYQQEFFNLFPNSWDSFKYMFDYMIDDNIKESNFISSNLYSESYEYICMYFNLANEVSLEEWCHKTIRICKNGYWDADAINYLQMGLIAIFLDSTNCYSSCFYDIHSKGILNVFCNTLLMYTDEDILSFWSYYLDSAVGINKHVYILTSKTISSYPMLKKLLLQQYKKSKNATRK